MIMWIKWKNLATPAAYLTTARAHSPARSAAARARVALLCLFLSFSIKMDNFQPNKLSKRSVKISYGIKPYTLNVMFHIVLFDLLNIIWAKPIIYPTIPTKL